MNKIYTLLIFALFLGTSSSYAQSTSLRSIKKSAAKAMENKDYHSAWKFYEMTTTDRSVRRDSTKLVEQMYHLAESARQFKSYEVAKNAYEVVLNSNSSQEYPLVKFWLGNVHQSQGDTLDNYDKAISYYSEFVREAGQTPKGGTVNTKQEYAEAAEKAIESCQWAKKQVKFKGFKMDSLKSVNTIWTEFAPLENNSSLYYSVIDYDTTNFCPDPNSEVTRLYTSNYAGEGETTSTINWAKEEKGKFVAHTAFNTTRERMYFTSCRRINAVEFECEIYYRNGMSGEAIRLPEEVNLTGTTSSQPNIGFDEKTGKELLFFVTNRADSLGGANGDMNIYCSIIEADGRVSAPTKIDVNTPEDDVTPFFNNTTKTLYFSSKGYKGFGGYDIYKAKQKEVGDGFENPSALKKPINSSYDDYYFSSDDEMENMYFTTNRMGVTYRDEGLETCCDDIYKLEIIKVNLEVTTFNTLTGEDGLDSCTVKLIDITDPKNPIAVDTLDPSGHFYKFKLEVEKDYRLESVRGKRWTYNGDENRNIPVEFTTRGITESTTLYKKLYHTPDIIWNVYTFVKTDECEYGSMVSLPKCTFNFSNELSEESSSEIAENNHFTSTLAPEMVYNILAEPENLWFEPFSASSNMATRSTKGVTTPRTFNDTLYFKLPDNFNVDILLYFHNDYPKRVKAANGGWVKNQKITYDKYDVLYDEYLARRGKYKGENRNNMGGLGNSDEVIDLFFDEYVKEQFDKIDNYILLLEDLANVFKNSNCQIEIDISGYTSPRASVSYNERLAYRRLHCFNEYIKRKAKDKPTLRNALPENAEDKGRFFTFKMDAKGEVLDAEVDLVDGKDEYGNTIKIEQLGGEDLNIRDEGPVSIYGIGPSKRRKVKVGKMTIKSKSSSSQSIR